MTTCTGCGGLAVLDMTVTSADIGREYRMEMRLSLCAACAEPIYAALTLVVEKSVRARVPLMAKSWPDETLGQQS